MRRAGKRPENKGAHVIEIIFCTLGGSFRAAGKQAGDQGATSHGNDFCVKWKEACMVLARNKTIKVPFSLCSDLSSDLL